MLKILHCADIHMDMPFTSLGTRSDKASIRRQDLKAVFKRIIDAAKEEEVNLLLISGDLFEHSYVRKTTIGFINDCFASIPEVEVFIVPGNHDPNIVNSYYRSFLWSPNVHILTRDKPTVLLDELGVCVYGMGFESFYEEACPPPGIDPVDMRYINILLVHGTVDLNIKGSPDSKLYNPLSSSRLAALGMDYVALGHFHNRIDDIGGYGNIYNPGSPEPLGYDECGEHGVYICTFNRTGNSRRPDVRFMKLNKRCYESLAINVDECNTTEQVIDRIHAAIKDCEKADGLFSIRLCGFLEPGFRIDALQIARYFEDKMFHVKLSDETSEAYDLVSLAGEPGLRGAFTRKLLDRIDKAGDEQQRKVLVRALNYGIQALCEGKVEVAE